MKIPEGALQQHVAVLGKTGSGKTFAMKGIVERWLEEKRRVAIVDPTGAWWGLRSSSNGRGAGFPVLVLGGDHGDLSLPALGGAAVARLLVDQGVNLVADTSLLTVGERTRWFIDFASTLYRANRAPLHLVLDEAHNFAPQGGGQLRDVDVGRMLHAANTLASGGRSRGIRLAMITQRPQKLHKDALTSADTLIAMRVLAPQDRAAVEDWIKGCGDLAQGKHVLNSLAQLPRGEGWVWWPEGGFLERMGFPAIRTFDSSATPIGGAVAAPKGAADIDLTEIRAALADAVKEAEANDPKLLRVEIARLRKELAAAKPRELTIEIDPPVIEQAEARGYALALAAVRPIAQRLETLAASVSDTILGLNEDLERLASKQPAPTLQKTRLVNHSSLQSGQFVNRTSHSKSRSTVAGDGNLPAGERKILIAILQHSGVTREQLTILTGYKRSSRDTYLQRLSQKSFVFTDELGFFRATPEGYLAVGDFEPLPTGDKLRAYWLGRLPEGERRVLEAIVRGYPGPVDRESISAATEYKRSSRDTYIQRLGARRLIVTGLAGGAVRASEELFG